MILMSAQLQTVHSYNLFDCDVTGGGGGGGDYRSTADHSPSGWPFGISSKERKQHQCQTGNQDLVSYGSRTIHSNISLHW